MNMNTIVSFMAGLMLGEISSYYHWFNSPLPPIDVLIIGLSVIGIMWGITHVNRLREGRKLS